MAGGAGGAGATRAHPALLKKLNPGFDWDHAQADAVVAVPAAERAEMHVTVAIRDPNYTFDPEVFPESAEGRELRRRLVVPPDPNNPVGVAWIGLDRTGDGIHGTPNPEQVGRPESHGCFRLRTGMRAPCSTSRGWGCGSVSGRERA